MLGGHSLEERVSPQPPLQRPLHWRSPFGFAEWPAPIPTAFGVEGSEGWDAFGVDLRPAEAQPRRILNHVGRPPHAQAASNRAPTPCERRPGVSQGALFTCSRGRSARLATPQQRERAEAEQAQGRRLGDDVGSEHRELYVVDAHPCAEKGRVARSWS